MVVLQEDKSVPAQSRQHTAQLLDPRVKWEGHAKGSHNVSCRRKTAFMVTSVVVQRSVWR